MNSDILKANWKQLKGGIKQKWGQLTDDDIAKIEGASEKLAGVLQEKYGYAKERAEKEIDTFVHAKRDYRGESEDE